MDGVGIQQKVCPFVCRKIRYQLDQFSMQYEMASFEGEYDKMRGFLFRGVREWGHLLVNNVSYVVSYPITGMSNPRAALRPA